MISWLLDLVDTRLVQPRCAPTVAEEDRCVVDEVGASMLMGRNEIVVSSATTQPGDAIIGGGGTLVHSIQLDLTTADGSLVAARLRRDRIVTAMVLPLMRDPTLGQADDDGSSTGIAQEVTRIVPTIQWGDIPASGATPLAAIAAIVLTATCEWRPTTLTP